MPAFDYLPRPADFFPVLRRGHGRGLGKRRPDPTRGPDAFKQVVNLCSQCRGNLCTEPGNVQEWLDERRLTRVPW